MDIAVKRLGAADMQEFIGLLGVFERAFEMKDVQLPSQVHLKKLLERKDFIVFIAKHDHAVIGGLTAHVLVSYYTASSEVYIYDLAIDTPFQRKGVGKKLIGKLGDFCRENGFSTFFVQADEVDAHALAFYRSTGGSPEQVVHFNYPINK